LKGPSRLKNNKFQYEIAKTMRESWTTTTSVSLRMKQEADRLLRQERLDFVTVDKTESTRA